MKNKYFQKMQRDGINYRKSISPFRITSKNRLYSEGASLAYKYWAVSERYNATDIFIDEIPDDSILMEFLDTYRKAGIKSLVLSIKSESKIVTLERFGCVLVGECKVFRRETELYYGSLEILKGYRVKL